MMIEGGEGKRKGQRKNGRERTTHEGQCQRGEEGRRRDSNDQ